MATSDDSTSTDDLAFFDKIYEFGEALGTEPVDRLNRFGEEA